MSGTLRFFGRRRRFIGDYMVLVDLLADGIVISSIIFSRS